MARLIMCDLCGKTVPYPLPTDSGWYAISLYRMGAKHRRGETTRVQDPVTVCPDCVDKLPFMKVLP